MERCINNFFYLTEKSLDVFKNAEEKYRILGRKRIMQYKSNGFEPDFALRFLKGTLKADKFDGVLASLIGYEFELYWNEMLKNEGAHEIKNGVSISHPVLGNTVIDTTAYLNGNQKFKTILPNSKEVFLFVKKGEHSFELKASNKLKEKALKQIKKAKGFYKKRHIIVLKDTEVPKEILKRVYKENGVDIIRAPITKKQLLDRILKLSKISIHVS